MKKFAIIAILGSIYATSASAAIQNVNASGFTFSYDDSYWNSPVSQSGNTVTFTNLGLSGTVLGAGTETVYGGFGFEGFVTIKANAGEQISQIVTSGLGNTTLTVGSGGGFSASGTIPYVNSGFGYMGNFGSTWVSNQESYVGSGSAVIIGGSSNNTPGETVTGTAMYLDYPFSGFVAGTTMATGLTFGAVNLAAMGEGSSAQSSIDSISYTVSVSSINPVPEPETYAMLLAGLGLIGAAVKRRKAKQA